MEIHESRGLGGSDQSDASASQGMPGVPAHGGRQRQGGLSYSLQISDTTPAVFKPPRVWCFVKAAPGTITSDISVPAFGKRPPHS